MRQIVEEYGGAILAMVATVAVIVLAAALLLSPGSVVSRGIERMTDGYLGDDIQESKEEMARYASMDPVELKVCRNVHVGETMELTEFIGTVGNQTLQEVRILNAAENNWVIEDGNITFLRRGTFPVRVYGENAEGNYGCSELWMSVGGKTA